MAEKPHSSGERPGWAGYVGAISLSALGHAGVIALALFVLPNWLHSAPVEAPVYTVKIVDNIPAGDLGTHLPKLSGRQPEPEEVAKAEVKPEAPPAPEETPAPPPEEDKNAIALATLQATPIPTPPAPAIAPTPVATATPKKVAEPQPTPVPPAPKPQHHEKVIVHNPPKAKNTPIVMAKAEKTPDVREQFRKLQRKLLEERIAEARKRAAEAEDNDDDDTADEDETSPDNGSSAGGPVASNANTPGTGYGVGPGTGSMGELQDLRFLLYYRQVQQKIKDAWTFPGGASNLTATVAFSIGADGSLASVKIAKSSGDGAFDDSVLRAFRRAAPFPPPPDKYRAQFGDATATFNLGELKS